MVFDSINNPKLAKICKIHNDYHRKEDERRKRS